MSSFCDRQAEACEVGAQAAVAIGQRAQAGAKMVYEFINDRVARSETGSRARDEARRAESRRMPAADQARSRACVPAALHGSQHTLKPTDLAPAWRGPPQRAAKAQPRKDGKQPRLEGRTSCRFDFLRPGRPATLYIGSEYAAQVRRKRHGKYGTASIRHVDRRDHREFRAARGVGRPLSLSHRARPRAGAAAGGRAQRRQQGAGLRQPGLACRPA